MSNREPRKTNVVSYIVLVVAVFVLLSALINLIGQRPAASSRRSSEQKTSLAGSQEEEWPPGLGEFQIDLEENPLKRNYYIILDGSGSMRGDKIDVAKEAIEQFVRAVPAGANIGLLTFDSDGIKERSPLTENKESIIDMVMDVQAGGNTPLQTAIEMGYQSIVVQARRQLGYGDYNLVIVTDGEASSGEDPRSIVNQILEISPITIHTIGFQIGSRHSLNQPGRILYKTASNYSELTRGLGEVLAEMEDFVVDQFE